jgi:hypothetical protein
MHKKGEKETNMAETGTSKLRGIRKRFDRGRCPPCLGEKEAKHIPLKCPETNKWRNELLCGKWLNINEAIAYRKIISYKNVTKLRTMEKI